MKLVYLSNFDGNINSGVNKKISGQVSALKKHFLTVDLIYTLNYSADSECINPQQNVSYIRSNVPPYSSFIKKIKSFLFLGKELEVLLNFEMDVLYIRNPIIPISVLKKLKKRKVKIVTELVSNAKQESLLRKSYFNAFIMPFIYKRRISLSDKIVAVTEEIAQDSYKIEDKPILELGNGYNIESNSFVSEVEYEEGTILKLACVANFNKWHAIDRLLYGLNQFEQKEMIKIYLIGAQNDEVNHLKKMVEVLDLSKQVEFIDFLAGEKLNKILSEIHIGISNLGIHRKKLSYTSPLKSREYCSKGIPFIYSGIDKDFKDFKYAYRFEANDNLIEWDEILNFANKIYSNQNIHFEMIKYSKAKLSYEVKALELAKFIKN